MVSYPQMDHEEQRTDGQVENALERQERLMRLIVSEDGLRAFISVSMKSGRKALTREDVLDFLERHEVIYGVKGSRIKILLRKLAMGDEVVRHQVAYGLEAKRGMDSEVKICVDTSVEAGKEDGADESIDFRERGFVCLVKQDALLLSATPPGPGSPGTTVMGAEIAAIPGEVDIPPIRSNVYDEEGLRWKASIEGQFHYEQGQLLEVSEELRIPGNLDFRFGNVDWDGAIVIEGDVSPGFSVVSRTSIKVKGDVQSEVNMQCDGPIEILGSINTGTEGLVSCTGDLAAAQILNSRVEVDGDVEVTRLIMNSFVVAGGHVSMTNPRSEIRGGRVEGVRGLAVSIAGSAEGVSTVLVSGLTLSYHDEAKALGRDISELSRSIDEAVRNFRSRYEKVNLTSLAPDERKRHDEAQARADHRSKTGMAQLAEMKDRRKTLREKYRQSDDETMIQVLREVFPGTLICIGVKARRLLKEHVSRESFYQQAGKIQLLSQS
ncbi:DUF342 domain-containing protein [bacterium AH-315-M10]|nr:DUF342 domain-containing protein [bacterium AH-315-M10]